MKFNISLCAFVFVCISTMNLYATILNESIGKFDFSDWKNVSKVDKDGAVVLSQEAIQYFYPDGKKHSKGFRNYNEGVANWTSFYGIRFWVYSAKEQTVNIKITLAVPDYENSYLEPDTKATVSVSGKGWHQVLVPLNQFEIRAAQRQGFLQAVKTIKIQQAGSPMTGIKIRQIALTKGETLSIEADIRGKAAPKGEKALYELNIGNTTNEKQAVSLSISQKGWESMITTIEPTNFELNAGEIKKCTVTVAVSDRITEGRRETQIINAFANGKLCSDAKIELITASQMPYPNILHTETRWQEVREKVKKYDWAKKELDNYVRVAEKWEVPNIATKRSNDNGQLGMHLFQTQEEYNLMAAGIAYQLTGEKKYAEKIAVFMRRLSDPTTGYPTTFRGCHQSFVQEGHFFQHIVMAYDMAKSANVFSLEDVKNIEQTFRLYMQTVDLGLRTGSINNWLLSEITGALYCALAVQDWHLVESFFNGQCGIVDHLSNGVMNDGWWYECTISYNVWASSEFSQIALALEPWGVNFKDMKIPSGTTPYYSLNPASMKPGKYGMNFDKWGPLSKNSVCIKDMWDALPAFTDYRGIMFGVNDATENMIAGQPYELAYFLYRDPEYAAIIRRGKDRDLLYGVPELPEVKSVLASKSAYADNMGIVLLRSQKTDRPQSEQIQAALHYGTHGGYHGHFDRTDLLHISRYGRSFYNPEFVWYGYPSYLYKFYVQTSVSKNMVVVDQKMQEPVESFRTLFHTGDMMQATVVETNARWSNPPYGGMEYGEMEGISIKEKAWKEGRSIPIPQKAPRYGELTDFSEPITQRRLMVVTDDYIVVSDYLKAGKEHTFDWLFQAKGFKSLESNKKQFLQHTAQMNNDPLGSGQFITDCDWWSAEGTTKSNFVTCWGKDCDNIGNRSFNCVDGQLQLDVYSLLPRKKDIMIGTAPEPNEENKQIFYTIKGDGTTLKTDSTGAWILGAADIDVPLNGIKELTLEVRSNLSQKPSLFWGNAKLILADGREMFLSQLPFKPTNIKETQEKGKDYAGGMVKIGGNTMTDFLPTMPDNTAEKATITLDLSGVSAVRFKTILGSDYPVGNESARRKTYSVRSVGKEATFLSIIEPFENQSVIKKAEALTDKILRIELKDGRVQDIQIENMDGKGVAKITMTETLNGKVIRTDTSK